MLNTFQQAQIKNSTGFMSQICSWIVCRLRDRTEIVCVGEEPYLLRCHILNHFWIFPAVYLHYFFRGDEDRALHNHPWKWALSLILSGGYIEERPTPESDLFIESHRYRPGDINWLTNNDFHRVSLTSEDKGCWTLFIPGPYSQTWGFKIDGIFKDHKEYGMTGSRAPLVEGGDIKKIRGSRHYGG